MKRQRMIVTLLLGIWLLGSALTPCGLDRAGAASYEFCPVNGPYGGCIRAIAVSPSYAGDGRVAVGTGNGFFLSTNRGASFQALRGGLQDHSQSATSVVFADSRTILVATEDGLYRSQDGGTGFGYSNRGLGGDGCVTAVALSSMAGADGAAFAGTYLGGAWKSADMGRSWSACIRELAGQNVVAIAVSPAYGSDRTVVFGLETASDIAGAWISTDGAATASALPLNSESTGNAVAFSPGYAQDGTFAVSLGADGVVLTSDRGATFTTVYDGTTTSLLFSPLYGGSHELFIGTAGSGLVTLDTSTGSRTVRSVPGGDLQSVAITALAASPAFGEDHTLFVGTSRLGLFVSRDGGRTLLDSNAGIVNARVNAVAVSPVFATDRTVFFGTAYQGVARTTDGGATVGYGNTGLTSLNILTLALSPAFAVDRTIAAGTDGGGISVSRDGGDSWSGLTDLSGCSVPWVAFAPDYAVSKTAFIAVEGDGLWRTRDGFASVHRLSRLCAGDDLFDDVVDCVAVSTLFPEDHTLFVGTHSGRVYRSTDGGDTLRLLDAGGLPGYALKDMRLSPSYAEDGTIYLCTDYGTGSTREAGVYRSTDRGLHWTQVASYVWYDALRISDAYVTDGTVLAVSWGSGLDITTNRGLVFGSVGSGIPLVGGKYWGNALDISPAFSRDHVVYVGLTNGGVYTTYHPTGTRTRTLTLTIGSTTLMIDGMPRTLDASPMIRDGRTLVPIRAIVEALGGTVAYEASDGKGRVDLALGSHTLSLWIGRAGARLDGAAVQVDPANDKVVPIIQTKRTYLPLRFVGESLGCGVAWDAATRTVTLTYRF